MWRALVLVWVFSCSLPPTEGLSFISDVIYRMLFPRQKPVRVSPVLQREDVPNKPTADFENKQTDSAEVAVSNLVGSVLVTMREIVPNDFALPNISYPVPLGGNLYMNLGQVHGLKSSQTPIINKAVDSEGNMEYTVEMHLLNLTVTYDDIFLDLYGVAFDRRGRAELKVFSNKIVAKLRVVKTSDIFIKITKNECAIFIKSVKVSDLGDMDVDIYNIYNKRAYLTSSVVDVVLTTIAETLSEQITLVIAKFIWDVFPDSNGIICRDKDLSILFDLATQQETVHQDSLQKKDTEKGTQQTNFNQQNDQRPEKYEKEDKITTDCSSSSSDKVISASTVQENAPIPQPETNQGQKSSWRIINWWRGEGEKKENVLPDKVTEQTSSKEPPPVKKSEGFSLWNWWGRRSPQQEQTPLQTASQEGASQNEKMKLARQKSFTDILENAPKLDKIYIRNQNLKQTEDPLPKAIGSEPLENFVTLPIV